MSDVGRITFGPRQTPEEARRSQEHAAMLQNTTINLVDLETRVCNCMGARPGETKCPCQLSAEMRKGSEMILNGVVISGVRYRLVPEA